MVAQDARNFHCRACVEDRNRCQWNDRARVYAAATPAGLDVLAGAGSGFDSLAVDRQRLERNAVTRLTGSGYYLAGIRASGSALVRRAAMIRGPAASLPENVDLCEDSSVHGVDTRGGYRLICPRRCHRGGDGHPVHPCRSSSLKTSAAKERPIPRGIAMTSEFIPGRSPYNDDYFSSG